MPGRLTVLIASYREPEHVERIRACDARLEVLYEPDLVARPTYRGDHTTLAERSPEQESRWRELLARAQVSFDFDYTHLDDLPRLAPRLKWVQATSAGIGQLLKKRGLLATDVVFTTASGVHGTSLAEFSVMAMLMHVKDAAALEADKKSRRWQRFSRAMRGGVLRVTLAGFLLSLVLELLQTMRAASESPPPAISRPTRWEASSAPWPGPPPRGPWSRNFAKSSGESRSNGPAFSWPALFSSVQRSRLWRLWFRRSTWGF